VARVGLGAEPPVEPPRLLRPLLSFRRLPAQALETVRRALEDDAEFRARVAGDADEGELDRASWLFLSRPAGWEDELRRAGRAAKVAAEVAQEDREERAARRQVRGAQEAARRAEEATRAAEQALAAARDRGARMAEELAAERDARGRGEQEVAALKEKAAGLEQSRDHARSRLAEVEARRAELERRLADAQTHQPESGGSRAWAEAFDQVRAATRAAAGAATELSEVLERIAAALEQAGGGGASGAADSATPASPVPPPSGPPQPEKRSDQVTRARRAAPAARPPARQPIRLPPGLLEEAPESAEHLVRINGVLLLVDGYNVSHACWPTLGIAEQRRRLVDALRELAARTGADVEVVFDGGEHDEPVPPGAAREPVRARFSPPGTEADDVILGMVERYPPHRPVVVATSDRRVREGVRELGANVISAGQLLKVLHRDRGW